MLRYIKQAWNEILNGENLELYATIFLSIIITILSSLGYAKPEVVSPIILTTLGLMAGSLLSNRKIMNNVQSSTNGLNAEIVNLRQKIDDGKRNLKIAPQKDHYVDLVTWINNRNKVPSKITLIQHSGVLLIDRILDPLMYLDTNIYLYQQCADSWDVLNLGGDTSDRISRVPSEIYLRENNNKDQVDCYKAKLYIKRFRSPASVRAILVDDDALVISWYVYAQKNGATNVKGSEYPGILAFKGTPEYESLSGMLKNICKDLDLECSPDCYSYKKSTPSEESKLIHIHEAPIQI